MWFEVRISKGKLESQVVWGFVGHRAIFGSFAQFKQPLPDQHNFNALCIQHTNVVLCIWGSCSVHSFVRRNGFSGKPVRDLVFHPVVILIHFLEVLVFHSNVCERLCVTTVDRCLGAF